LKKFDYIIIGAGCAGLSLVMRMIREGVLQNKKLLLLDRAPKTRNDRTWCFWEQAPGFFEPVVYRKWDQLLFKSPYYSAILDIDPYAYKMIRGVDFYRYCFEEIRNQSSIEIKYAKVKSLKRENDRIKIETDEGPLAYECATVFNSIYAPPAKERGKHYLLQHFKGWTIEARPNAFNPEQALFMDFRIDQQEGLSFIYMLPVSDHRALVEYTQFSGKLLKDEVYDARLRDYISSTLGLKTFEVVDTEFGVIPMTNHPFAKHEKGVWNIGTAGGQTKASTGYTFQFIQKQADQIANALKMDPLKLNPAPVTASRFQFYDGVLLRILEQGKPPGREVFTRLFQKNRASEIFCFLDNESKFGSDLKIIHSLPTWPFTRAAISEIWNRLI